MKFKLKSNKEDIDVNSYQFEPIKGYPMLNWKGKRPFNSTQYYPAQLKETHGEMKQGWSNKIFWGDNLQVMSHMLKSYRGQVKLIYIDPPFDSKADYKMKIQVNGKAAENYYNAYEEKQYTDIWTNDEYLQFMYERLLLMKELLAEDGSIYIQCDSHKSHHIRCIMDEIFGAENFQNEIIWKRGNHKKATNRFATEHDCLFLYSKSSNFIFNPQFTEYSESYIKDKYSNEEDGRRYQLQAMYGKGSGPALYFGERLIYPPAGLHWRWNQEKINEAMDNGIIVFPNQGKGMPRFKDFLDTKKGLPVRTIWGDITEVNSQADERTNYPTQKPEKLLERIISTSSNPGDIIFDCFMGSGTTQAVALKLRRNFIGADINLGAVQKTTKRLLKLNSDNNQLKLPGFEVYNVNNYDIFKNPVQAKEILIEALEIQKIYNNSLYDGEKDGRLVKIMPVNRITTRADLNGLITSFDYKLFEKRQSEYPNQAVEKLMLVCMGHESDLAATLEHEVGFKLDVEVVDILRDKSNLEFKRDSEVQINCENNMLVIKNFYPMNLLQKLSIMKENIHDWKELVDSIMIDWNFDGAVLEPSIVDIPAKNELVSGTYKIPEEAGTIRVKITDLISESIEVNINRD